MNFVSNLITAGSLLTVRTSDKSTNVIITVSIREVLFYTCVGFAPTLRVERILKPFEVIGSRGDYLVLRGWK